MKTLIRCLLFILLTAIAHAEQVTPAMEADFLSKLKTAVAHKNHREFRNLFYESQDKGQWLTLQTIGPFDMVFSDAPRTYDFQLPGAYPTNLGRPVIPYISPIFHDAGWKEELTVAIQLKITFNRNVPGTSGNEAFLPLIVKHGKLYAVEEMSSSA